MKNTAGERRRQGGMRNAPDETTSTFTFFLFCSGNHLLSAANHIFFHIFTNKEQRNQSPLRTAPIRREGEGAAAEGGGGGGRGRAWKSWGLGLDGGVRTLPSGRDGGESKGRVSRQPTSPSRRGRVDCSRQTRSKDTKAPSGQRRLGAKGRGQPPKAAGEGAGGVRGSRGGWGLTAACAPCPVGGMVGRVRAG